VLENWLSSCKSLTFSADQYTAKDEETAEDDAEVEDGSLAVLDVLCRMMPEVSPCPFIEEIVISN